MDSVKSRLRRVRDSYKNADFNETVLLCEGILEGKADCYEACLFLGKAAYSLGDDEKAEVAYVRATSITDSLPPAWQGLAEVYERTESKDEAIPVLEKLVLLTESDSSKNIAFKLRLAKLFASTGKPDEGLKLLEGILNTPDLPDDTKLSALCQQADIQLMSQDSRMEARITEILESRDSAEHALDENLDPAALRARVMGEYMEEALQANSPVCLTLKTIVQMVPPFPENIKYYESYLLMYCKALYSAEPESLARYHLRVQTLEQCYKMIMGKSGGCCSPFPFTTALRLLEIKEEILGGQKIGPGQDTGTPILSRRTSSTSGSFRMTSTTVSLYNLPPASDPDMEGRIVQTMWETRQAEMKIKVTAFHQRVEVHDETVSPFHHKPFSPNSHNISTGATGGLQSPSFPQRRMSSSGSLGVDLHGVSGILPTFMRSYSLEVVRKLHRLGSGILPDSEDFIGSNSPILLEITERIGRRLIHMFPWEAESNVQLVLALRRRRASVSLDDDDNTSERRVTYLHSLRKQVHSQIQNWNEAALRVLTRGLSMGSHSAAGEFAAVELMLEEGQYQKALTTVQEAIEYLESRKSRGGYPMTQAYLTFKLLLGNAYLGLERLDEADEEFNKLLECASEGETSFGWMVGSVPVSLRQAAHRGLAHASLARGDRVTARQKYEEVLGASIMGKAPLEHWAEAEYGWMLYEDGDASRARNHLEAALELIEENFVGLAAYVGEYNFKLAKIYWCLGSKWKTEKSFAHAKLMLAAKSEGDFQAKAFALLGKYYLDVEVDKQKARKCFQRALELDPAQDDAGNALMELLIEGGTSLLKLLGFCKEMLSRDGAALWALEGKGRMANALGDHQSAVVAFKTVLKKRLNDASLWEAIGAAYLGMGRLTASLKSFDRAVELDPNRLFALVQAGKLNAQTGDSDASLHCFNQALSIDANYPPALLGMAEALLASCRRYLRMGVAKIAASLANEARKLAERCTKFHGNLKSAWKVLGDVDYLHHAMPPVNDDTSPRGCRRTPQDFVKEAQAAKDKSFLRVRASRRSYAHALHLDPSEGTFWGDVAASCYQESRLRKAYGGEKPSMDEQQLRSLSEKLLLGGVCLCATSVHLWEALGMCSSDPKLREYSLHRALQLNPKNITSWVALAKVYQDCGNRKLAEDCLEHARSHDPEAVSIWEGMASLSTYQSPLELYEHAVGLGGSPNSFLGYAIHAVIHDKQGPPEVHASARKAVENYPLLAPAHHALGMCEESRGLPFKALDAFETALDLLGGQKGFPAPEDWHSLGNEALMYLTAKARALCGLKRYEDARDIYLALESAGKLQELWAAKVCLGKALWETGDLEGSVSALAGVIQSPCGIHLKLAAVKTLVGICIVEKKLVECGGLVDNVCHQIRSSPDRLEYEPQLPDLYLALLAGAYVLGAKDLVCKFATSASSCVKGHGAQETTVVAKIYLIRHLALASSESTDTKAIHNRIRQAVHTAPWDPEVRMHLMKGSKKEALLILGLMQRVLQDADPQESNDGLLNIKELKREIFLAKCSIRCEPTEARLWCQLALLQFQLAQNLGREADYSRLKLTCNRALHWIQVKEKNGDESEEELCKSMQMHVSTLLSEAVMHMKEADDIKSLEYAESAVEVSKGLGPQHQGMAERHLGRVYISLGRQSEGESWLRKAVENNDRIAAIELGALLRSQGKTKEADDVLGIVESQ